MQKIVFPLPSTINKYMEFEPLDKFMFKRRWSLCQGNIIMNIPLKYDYLTFGNDIKKYYPFLIELNEPSRKEKNKSESKPYKKWGGVFSINEIYENLIKIIIFENFIIFQISVENGNRDLSEKVLETLCFIFCE